MFAALVAYILLPYLSSFMPVAYTGLVIAGGAAVGVILFPYLPRIVARYGAQRLALGFAIAEMLALLALAAAPGALASILLIAVTISLQSFLSYGLDILLEATGTEDGAGRVRTTFLTGWNIATLAAPLLMGALLAHSDAFGRVFLAAAAATIPLIILLTSQNLPKGAAPKVSHIRDTMACILQDRDFAAVTFGHLILYLFYIWAPLYVPFYLHTMLDIPWATLGWMFSIMLIPYVLVEYPAGWIADRFLGDKELMLAGFLIAGGAVVSLSFLSPSSPLVLILLILIGSRVGTALIESMTTAHFFRRVSEQDITSISFFRGVWPVANLIAPVVGSLILYFGTYQLFFLLTGGFIAIAGVATTLRIRDFR